jgi:hypothetical protein
MTTGEQSMHQDKGHYDVVWPLGRSTETAVALNARFADSKAKRIGFLWDYIFRGEQMFPLIQAGLAEKFPGSTFVPHTAFGNIHGHDEREVLADLPRRLREEKLDAVVVGVGA